MKKNRLNKKGSLKSDLFPALMFLLPSITGTLIFFLFPYIDTVRRSLYDTSLNNFVLFENFSSVTQNESFRLAAYNTLRFIAICIPSLLLISLFSALLMHSLRPGGKKLKTFFLIPMAVPAVSMTIIWQVLFHDNGMINSILTQFSHDKVNFMYSNYAFWVLTITYIWKNTGYDMILWLAGLDAIPESLYEAAAVDGAGKIRSFFYITLPSLIPSAGMVTVLSLLNSFKVFREAYLVSGAYPHDSMYMLQHLFNNWFANMDISRLSAAAVILCLGLVVIIIPVLKLFKSVDREAS